MVYTILEDIPNEIIATILSYITSIEAVIIFSKLNSRFQDLLRKLCLKFDLTSVSKKDFDIVFQNQDTDRWQALKLSDNDYTPGEVNYFFQKYTFMNNFSNLQWLSIIGLEHCHSYPIFIQLPSLLNLVSLEIESICARNIPETDLPNLKKLKFTSCPKTHWLANFARLETIEYIMTSCHRSSKRLIWPRTLKYLKITYKDYQDTPIIQQSLENLSQLNDLEVHLTEPERSFPHGQIWEQTITTWIPSLKNFKFCFQFLCYEGHLNDLKQVIASFSTPFYTVQNNWPIRCDVSAHYQRPIYDDEYGRTNDSQRHVILYTIPYSFESMTLFKIHSKRKNADWSRNSLDYQKNNMPTKLNTLIVQNYSTPDPMFHQNLIKNLIIHTPFDALPWINMFTHVRNLTIGDGSLLSPENFNLFMNHTPHLCSISIRKTVLKQLTDNWTDICVCHHLSQKIRSLILTEERNTLQCFDRNELEKVLPIFALHCRQLSLGVHSHHSTIDLIFNKMPHLISLYVHIQRKNCPEFTIEWLEKQSTRCNRTNCILTNVRHGCYFWLDD